MKNKNKSKRTSALARFLEFFRRRKRPKAAKAQAAREIEQFLAAPDLSPGPRRTGKQGGPTPPHKFSIPVGDGKSVDVILPHDVLAMSCVKFADPPTLPRRFGRRPLAVQSGYWGQFTTHTVINRTINDPENADRVRAFLTSDPVRPVMCLDYRPISFQPCGRGLVVGGPPWERRGERLERFIKDHPPGVPFLSATVIFQATADGRGTVKTAFPMFKPRWDRVADGTAPARWPTLHPGKAWWIYGDAVDLMTSLNLDIYADDEVRSTIEAVHKLGFTVGYTAKRAQELKESFEELVKDDRFDNLELIEYFCDDIFNTEENAIIYIREHIDYLISFVDTNNQAIRDLVTKQGPPPKRTAGPAEPYDPAAAFHKLSASGAAYPALDALSRVASIPSDYHRATTAEAIRRSCDWSRDGARAWLNQLALDALQLVQHLMAPNRADDALADRLAWALRFPSVQPGSVGLQVEHAVRTLEAALVDGGSLRAMAGLETPGRGWRMATTGTIADRVAGLADRAPSPLSTDQMVERLAASPGYADTIRDLAALYRCGWYEKTRFEILRDHFRTDGYAMPLRYPEDLEATVATLLDTPEIDIQALLARPDWAHERFATQGEAAAWLLEIVHIYLKLNETGGRWQPDLRLGACPDTPASTNPTTELESVPEHRFPKARLMLVTGKPGAEIVHPRLKLKHPCPPVQFAGMRQSGALDQDVDSLWQRACDQAAAGRTVRSMSSFWTLDAALAVIEQTLKQPDNSEALQSVLDGHNDADRIELICQATDFGPTGHAFINPDPLGKPDMSAKWPLHVVYRATLVLERLPDGLAFTDAYPCR